MEMTASTITDDGNIELDIRVARPSRTNNVREIDGMGQHSKVPTPDHHPSSLDETQSESITDHASIADSAYVSKAPTSIAGASETTVQGASAEELISAQQEGQWIRGTDLYWFKEPVENPARKHYRKVGLKIGTFLTDVIRSASKDRSQKLAVNVKVIGKTKQDARARLVVFCVPEVEEVVRKEMNGSYVTDILSYHRYNIPKLDFLVIADAPTMVSKYLDVNISSNNFFTHHCDTFCGAPILLQSSRKDSNNESKQLGTFGGMIEVTYSGGTQLFGMTAGHNIEHLQKKQVVTNLGIEDSCSNAFVDLGGWICEHSIIGAVLDTSAAPAVANGIVTQSHDWALFEVKEPRPNLANHPLSEDVASHEILKAERPLFNDDLSDPVLLLGGTKGTRRGELSSLPAFICISDTLVEVFTLELHEGGGTSY
jgi:hypothetical protein